MPFPCPACHAAIERSPGGWALRCPGCGALLRSRASGSDERVRIYEVEVAGRPETRQRVEVPWGDADARRLSKWLLWSTVLTLGLIILVYVVARAARHPW